jgi:hypothetical protein
LVAMLVKTQVAVAVVDSKYHQLAEVVVLV